MGEVIRVTNKVYVQVSWCSYRLSTLATLDYFLELGPGGLDLTSCILHFLDFFVSILFLEVIVSSQNRLSLIAEVLALKLASVLDGLRILFHSLLNIVLVEARRIVDHY